jgi:mycothiol synthase
VRIAQPDALDEETAHKLRTLAGEVEALDGSPPLSDQALVQLTVGGTRVRHVVAADESGPTGYAQATLGADAASVEVLVGPVPDRPGLADALVETVAAALPARRILAWAHGATSPVRAALERHGFAPVRSLLRMQRPLDDVTVDPPPEHIRLRTFEVGKDEAAWLAVNARAFADHPEQGGWTTPDLLAREREDWFDPAGFFLAEDVEGTLLGYHWTKLHPGPPQVGEVYVLGVDPAAQGRHLGGALLSAGLAWLRDQGARTAMLYSDDSNLTAVRLYEKRGFRTVEVDTQYELRSTVS